LISNSDFNYNSRLLSEEYDSLNSFKASNTWLANFKSRFKLSSRTKSNQGQTAAEDSLKLAQEFGLQVQKKAKEMGVVEIWNADHVEQSVEIPALVTDTLIGALANFDIEDC